MVAYWLSVLDSLCWKFSDYWKITNFMCFGYYCDKRGYDIQCLILENLRTIWGGLITVGYWLFRIVGIPKSENGCKFVMFDLV
jgi:hypothetical protein